MGNCLDRKRGGGGGGAAHCGKKGAVALVVEEEEVHGGREKAPAPVAELKIRITRKQLEDLLRRLDKMDGGGGGAVVSELLCMTSGASFRHKGQAVQWRPALQSIPE